jgi:hypothetical protein
MHDENWVSVPSADGGYYSIPLSEIGVLLDALQSARQNMEEPLQTMKRLVADQTALVNYRCIVNYWFPKLGYTQANDMAYPALGDRRAVPSPVLALEQKHQNGMVGPGGDR